MTSLDVMPDRRDAGGLVQALDLAKLVAHGEGHNEAGRASPRSAARTVQVILVIIGRVEVDYELDAVHVDAPGRDVGGNKDPRVPGRKRVQRTLALVLVPIAVDRS